MEQKRIGIDVPIELWKEIGIISRRENKPIKIIGKELFETYAKEHGDGNPGFTLDQFRDPQMKAIPATMRDLHDWQHYIDNLTEKEYRELEPQIHALKSKMDERWKRGF
jgi:hypothetical protein